MNRKEQPDLEAFISEELKRLPELPAPPALARRVQEAIHQEELELQMPWWRRAWWHWPAPARICSLTLFGLLGIVACVAPWTLEAAVSGLGARWSELFEPLQHWLTTTDSLLATLEGLGRSLARSPLVLYGAGACLLSYLFLVGVGSFYVRFAFPHTRPASRHEQ